MERFLLKALMMLRSDLDKLLILLRLHLGRHLMSLSTEEKNWRRFWFLGLGGSHSDGFHSLGFFEVKSLKWKAKFILRKNDLMESWMSETIGLVLGTNLRPLVSTRNSSSLSW